MSLRAINVINIVGLTVEMLQSVFTIIPRFSEIFFFTSEFPKKFRNYIAKPIKFQVLLPLTFNLQRIFIENKVYFNPSEISILNFRHYKYR